MSAIGSPTWSWPAASNGANAESAEVAFTIKGAVALEMRLPDSARATKDIDVIGEAGDDRGLAEVLEQALAEDYQDFAFRIKDDPYVMPNGSVRFQCGVGVSRAELEYRSGRPFPRGRRHDGDRARRPARPRAVRARHTTRRYPASRCAITWRRRFTG